MTANAPIDTHARFLHRAVTAPHRARCRARPDSSRAAGLACGMDRGRGNSHRPSTATLGDIFGHGNGNYGVARMPERRGKGGLMTGKADQSSTRICALNDELRRFGRGGRIMITPGIQALRAEGVALVLAAVAAFDAFTGDNDPYGEHDCAVLAVDGIEVLFKIDYYDRDLVYHSPDPSDPTVTQRVMVVMLASEY